MSAINSVYQNNQTDAKLTRFGIYLQSLYTIIEAQIAGLC